MVSQFAVFEFGAAIRLSRRATESLFSEVLELAYRLPQTWARVNAGKAQAWKARHVANATNGLSAEAAAFVDSQVARYVSRISPAELQRLIDAATARFMPDYAREIAQRTADGRFVTVSHQQVSFNGTSQIYGELDLVDALDLDQALRAGAQQLADLGSDSSLDVRRSEALGNLARGELTLDLTKQGSSEVSTSSTTGGGPARSGTTTREVVLYVHLSEAALGAGGTGLIENPKRLVTAEQIREWCRTTGRVSVRPVVDLNEEITSTGYRPTERHREQIILRDGTCPFPYCERNARYGDIDHIEAYDPNGPPDQTATSNLAGLCRSHHRLKTHGGWNYTTIEPGRYLWRSPHGYSFLTDRSGTQDLTPRPLEPPGERSSPSGS